MKKGATAKKAAVNAAKKWIPKGAETKADGDALENVADKEEYDLTGANDDQDGPITSPLLLEPSTGPSYDKMFMLRLFEAVRSCPEKELAAIEQPEEPKEPEIADTEQPGVSLTVSLSERPAGEPEGGKTPGARRQLREQMKVKKAAKRASELGLNPEDSEVLARTAAAQASEVADEEEEPDAATAGAQQIALSQGLSGGTNPSMMTADVALMTYLTSMSYSAPPMPMYGSSIPGYTTVMLRNIPNRYTRDMLIERLNQNYEGQYDFVYLPIDFNSKCNVGYAFINFRTPTASYKFIQEFHKVKTKHCLPGFSSAKVCEVSYARVQGREANMENLRDEKFIEKLNERPEWQPLFYDESGEEIPFAKTLGSGRKRTRSESSPTLGPAAMPPAPPQMPGYVMTPYGPMVYPTGPMTPYHAAPTAMPQEFSLTAVLPAATPATMLMLRNIPTKCTREKLIENLNQKFKGGYDFVYLPADPKNEGLNRSFAFINLRSTKKARAFTKAFHSNKVSTCFPEDGVDSTKECEVESARIQNLEASLDRLRTAVAKEPKDPDWLPLLFDANGEPTPFPLSTGGSKAPPAPTPAPATVGPLPPVPTKALDARALEMKMHMEVQPTTPAATASGTAESSGATAAEEKDETVTEKADQAEEATPPAPSEEEEKTASAPPPAQAPAPPVPASPGGSTGLPAAGFPTGFPAGYPPGYPGYPGMMGPQGIPPAYAAAQMAQAAAVARAAVAQQAAHLSAHAAATAHAGHHSGVPAGPRAHLDPNLQGLLDPLAAAVNPREGQPLQEEQRAALRKQIEFYFSTDNLCKDLFLRSHMNPNGWTPLELIAQFPQVRKYKATLGEIAEALTDSTLLEVNAARYMRLKDEETRSKWVRVHQG